MKRPKHSIHRSIDYERVEQDLANGREKSLEVAFADEWEGENKPQSGINQGRGVLQNLMFGRPDSWGHSQMRLIITARDAAVAATAIQWLGTNCGSAWLANTVKRAGWLLLHPSEAAHYAALEEDMHRREMAVWEREKKAKAREDDMFLQREARLQQRAEELEFRSREIEARSVAVESRIKRWEEGKANWIALMMLASRDIFRYVEPSRRRRRRKIALVDD